MEGVNAGDRARALRFLAGVTLVRDPRSGRPSVLRTADGESVPCDVYRPAARAPWGTVLFVHGMSLRAHRDPRVVVACNALCAAGLQVVAPRVAGLCELRMDRTIPSRIADLLLACGADPALGRPDRVAVASASFAAGLCLKAAARPEVRFRVAALFLVGAYVDARMLLAHLLTSPDPDPFGRLILLRAFLGRDPTFPRQVLDVIDVALADESLRSDPPQLPAALASLAPDEVHLFERLRTDPEEGARLAHRIEAQHGDEIDAFSAIDDLAGIGAPVTLVHGRDDRVIPASESRRAAAAFAVHGVPYVMRTTALLDHGDLGSPLAKLGELPHLLEVLGYWFGSVRRASATTATAAQVASSTTNGQYAIR